MLARLLLLGLVAALVAGGRGEASSRAGTATFGDGPSGTGAGARDARRRDAPARPATAPAGGESVAGADAEREAVAEAVRAREAEVERAPGDPEAHFQLGLALCDHVHHVGVLDKLGVARRLREELEAAVGLDPAHVGARIALIEFHRQAPPIAGGRPDEVRRHAEELLALEPVEGRLALARMLRKYGEPRAAERHVRQVLGVDPTHRDALLLLARLAEDVGRLEEARVVLAALLLVSPDDDEARLLLADLAAASTGCPGSPASD